MITLLKVSNFENISESKYYSLNDEKLHYLLGDQAHFDIINNSITDPILLIYNSELKIWNYYHFKSDYNSNLTIEFEKINDTSVNISLLLKQFKCNKHNNSSNRITVIEVCQLTHSIKIFHLKNLIEFKQKFSFFLDLPEYDNWKNHNHQNKLYYSKWTEGENKNRTFQILNANLIIISSFVMFILIFNFSLKKQPLQNLSKIEAKVVSISNKDFKNNSDINNSIINVEKNKFDNNVSANNSSKPTIEKFKLSNFNQHRQTHKISTITNKYSIDNSDKEQQNNIFNSISNGDDRSQNNFQKMVPRTLLKSSDKGLNEALQGSVGKVSFLERDLSQTEGLDKEIIAQIMKSNLGQVLYCYERQLSADPSLQGKISVQFQINSNGKVINQKILTNTMNNKTISDCIISKLQYFQFPNPKNGVTVQVNYPFLFKNI